MGHCPGAFGLGSGGAEGLSQASAKIVDMERRMNEALVTGPGAIRFAETARSIGRAARLRGLEVPTFRSPPGLIGVQRTIRRRGASATVSVVVRGRPWAAVVSDMVEGVVAANRLDSRGADTVRAALWVAVDGPALAA